MDNTTFGNDVPTIPHWTGPPRAIVYVQAILFASLVVSLLSAFLAMLGKQWLNRYDSIDMRGTAIERSQNRQRKLDGIVVWYFENVMESLPLMLQAALLLFGCALSRYLWEIDVTIASVVLGVTSVGVIFYLSIVVAGTASESCPYQTPGAHILRHRLLPALRSTSSKFSGFIITTYCYNLPIEWWGGLEQPWYSIWNVTTSLFFFLFLHIAPVIDVCRLGRAMLQSLVAFGRAMYRRSVVASLRTRDLGQQAIALDLRCVSWMLQASLDKGFHLTTLKYLAAMPELTSFDPSLVTGCFNVFISCINIVDHTFVTVQGLEKLATLSASCFLHTLHHFFGTDPTLSTLVDLRRRYHRVFSSGWVDFRDAPFRYTMIAANILVNQQCKPPKEWRWWDDIRPSTEEHIQLVSHIVGVAQAGYQRTRSKKVPRWTLRFAFDSLSLDPPLPPLLVACCLKIIAVDLGCDILNIKVKDERYVWI